MSTLTVNPYFLVHLRLKPCLDVLGLLPACIGVYGDVYGVWSLIFSVLSLMLRNCGDLYSTNSEHYLVMDRVRHVVCTFVRPIHVEAVIFFISLTFCGSQ